MIPNWVTGKPVKRKKLSATLMVVAISCFFVCPAYTQEAAPDSVMWASSVVSYSSQYGSGSWSANQTLGPPNVYPSHGDNTKAWASQTSGGRREFLEVGYSNPISIIGVDVYETDNPGAVDKVEARDPDGTLHLLWSGSAEKLSGARIFQIRFPPTSFLVKSIRISLDSPAVSGWNEIDAIGIIIPFSTIQITHQPFSDTYDLQNKRVFRKTSLEMENLLLFYRVDGGSFTVVSLADTAASTLDAIPGIPPFPPGTQVDYYLENTDAEGNIVLSPPDAPLSLHTYHIIEPPEDIIARGFLHTPTDSVFYSKNTRSLSATLRSYRKQATKATLFYRTTSSGDFIALPMTTADSAGTAEIPSFPWGTTVEYFFHATDELGDIHTPAGAPDELFHYLIHAPEIQVSPSSLSFVQVEIAQTQIETLTVTNSGNSQLAVSSMRSLNPRFRPLVTALNIAPEETALLPVAFTPLDDTPLKSTLIIHSNDPLTDSLTVALGGMVEVIPDEPPSGDLDRDGEITSGDAILALRMAADLIQPADDQRLAADVDEDGEITSGDAILILRKAAGLIESFSKPAAVDVPLARVDAHQKESAQQPALSLAFELTEGTAGGDLSLTLGAGLELSGDILLQGLSPEALFVTNTNGPGEIRISFIDSDREEESRPLSLIVPVDDLEPEAPITLQGLLYNHRGRLTGEIHFEETTAGPLPSRFVLQQNYPNPFNPSTSIRFALPQAEHAILNIYALTGQRVRTLVDGPLAAGKHAVEWDGKDRRGRSVSSGIYLYRLSVDEGRSTATRRMLLIK
jgi:hypothetical protein